MRTTVFAVAIGLCCLLAFAAARNTPAQALPIYKVDPFWPKPLPNKWLIQGVPTMVTDKDDHIWVLNRPRDIMPDEAGAPTKTPRNHSSIAPRAPLGLVTFLQLR